MSFQPIYCRICACPMQTEFGDKWADEVCSKHCYDELLWRKQLASENKIYIPKPAVRVIRIAELDRVQALDSLIKDLEGIPDLKVDRYLIPREVYSLFAYNPPPAGLAFPIATLETDNNKDRVYGLADVISLLRRLVVTSFAATRKMKQKRL